MTLTPTPEQGAVIEHIARPSAPSLNVDALAGAAKSSTLRMAAPQVRGKALALAFNVGIKDALKASLPDNFEVLTINGLGHRAWQRLLGNTKLDVKNEKKFRIIREALEQNGWTKADSRYDDMRDFVISLYDAARTHGLVPKGAYPGNPKSFYTDDAAGWNEVAFIGDIDLPMDNADEIIEIARQSLTESIKQAYLGKIDFGDQIYMPCCFSGSFPRYPMIFVDEAQDLSPLNHYMLKRVAAGRVVAVGDERQSIYAFRGADAESVPKLRETFKMDVLGLTTTFRCSENIVKNVHWHAPQMRWAEWNSGGEVTRLREWSLADLEPGAAVICRNNAPLFALAFKLLNRGVSIVMLGSEISRQLIAFINRLAERDPSADRGLIEKNLDEWEAKEIEYAIARDNPLRVEAVQDKAAVVRALRGRTARELIESLERVFANTEGQITLCSGHKSKGLEWDTVYHLNPHYLPSRFAKTQRAKVQEANLKYVIDTRARKKLIYVNSDLLGEKGD